MKLKNKLIKELKLKNHNKFIYFVFLCIAISCIEKEKNDFEVKVIDQNLFFEGKKDSSNNFYKYYSFYSVDKNPLINMLFYENNDSVFHYELTVRNNEKRIISQLEVKNGFILKEYNYGNKKNSNIDSGAFYYKNYCYQCHHRDKESVGTSLFKLSKLNNIQFNSRYFKYKHELTFNNNELDSIYFFISNITY